MGEDAMSGMLRELLTDRVKIPSLTSKVNDWELKEGSSRGSNEKPKEEEVEKTKREES